LGGRGITIAEAGPRDRVALAALLAEMGRFYGERTDAATIGAAAEALSTPAGRAGPFCLLARLNGAPAGLVSLSGFFPAFDFTWGLLLKDLFVAEAARRTGTARALMTEAMRFAAVQGYTRVDWTTEPANGRARAFYASLGIAPAGRIFYRLEGERLAAAAQGRWPATEEAP
jgi:GNAT superfamily N-acetyltransferase